MPPATPSTTSGGTTSGAASADTAEPYRRRGGTRPDTAVRDGVLLLGALGGQQARVDLAERDRERLLLRRGLHEGTNVLEETLTELAVVGVDLAGTLGREDH